MFWVLVLVLSNKSVDHIDGYANLQMCEVAGERFVANQGYKYREYVCIPSPLNKTVESK